MSDLIRALLHIGAIQFGQFATDKGIAPVAIHLRLLPSYPAVLKALAQEVAPLVQIEGLTHLLTTPSAVPVGVAVALAADLPLVYPSPEDPQSVEGAYDYGQREKALIARVKALGLDVKVTVAVLDLGINASLDVRSWRRLPDILPELTTIPPLMRQAVASWLQTWQQT
jgi:hypothetical protein